MVAIKAGPAEGNKKINGELSDRWGASLYLDVIFEKQRKETIKTEKQGSEDAEILETFFPKFIKKLLWIWKILLGVFVNKKVKWVVEKPQERVRWMFKRTELKLSWFEEWARIF